MTPLKYNRSRAFARHLLLASFVLAGTVHAAEKNAHTVELIDPSLSHFEVFVGIPHATVTGLPDGTYQSANVWQGEPMGLGADVKNIFSAIEMDGEPVLKVTGEIYAGLTTKMAYANYHFITYFKWGQQKWAPRLDKPLDSGILYHCYGPHGRFWNVWMSCIEYQIMENDIGDYIPLGVNSGVKERGPSGKAHRAGLSKAEASQLEKPVGEWNLLEIYTVGNSAFHLLNGQVVYVVEHAHRPDGFALTGGQIQLQSEAAECYYKGMTITPITAFPEDLEKLLQHQK